MEVSRTQNSKKLKPKKRDWQSGKEKMKKTMMKINFCIIIRIFEKKLFHDILKIITVEQLYICNQKIF